MNLFDKAFERVMGSEGRFQDQTSDRGNWTGGVVGKGVLKGTKFGVSAMSYPHLDIRNITLEEAKAIYYSDFWLPLGGETLPSELVYQAFDASVNHGLPNCVRMFQRALFVDDDGHFGPKSMKALHSMGVHDLLMRFLAQRLRFMTNTRVWDINGKGWARRIADNLEYAAIDTLE